MKDEIVECEGEELKTVSFFHQTVDDFMSLGVISPGDDSPFLRPDIYKKFDLEEKKKEGSAEEGCFGESFEDGVYEGEDEEEEMGEQKPLEDGDPFGRQQAPLHGKDIGAWGARRLSDAHQAIFACVSLGYAPCWMVVDALQATRRRTNSLRDEDWKKVLRQGCSLQVRARFVAWKDW